MTERRLVTLSDKDGSLKQILIKDADPISTLEIIVFVNGELVTHMTLDCFETKALIDALATIEY